MQDQKICIGIISWLPDINSIRGVRIQRLQTLINYCGMLMNLPIIIIAQNWRSNEIYLSKNCHPYFYPKLGITGARKELRNKFIQSEYDKIILLDDDMELYPSTKEFKKYLSQVEEHDICEYKNFLMNFFSITKECFKKLEFDDIEAERGEGYEDWIYISKLRKLFPDKVHTINDCELSRYPRKSLVNDNFSTWFHNQYNKDEMTEKSRVLIEGE